MYLLKAALRGNRRISALVAILMCTFFGIAWATTKSNSACLVSSTASRAVQLSTLLRCLSKPIVVVGRPAPPVAVPPVSIPAPAPAPSSTPIATAPITAVNLAGLAPVSSGTGDDLSRYIRSAPWGIPGHEAVGEEGAFRFLCAPSHNAYDDPIVYPGQPGKAHLHTFFGNTKTDANSTYASLRTTGEGSCNNLMNRSAYWMPSMMHPSGKVVMPDYISIYYKRAPADSKYCAPPFAQACLALPRGLRYVFGYNMSDPAKSAPAGFGWFNCDGADAVSGHFTTIAVAAKGCPRGAHLGAVIVGPNCWNGRELDSADHRSHMAYQAFNAKGEAVCPATHPYLLPFFEAGAWYKNDGTAASWRFSSDQMMGTEGGVTLHADWFGAWEDSVKDAWTANCIDKALNCSGGDLGDGRYLESSPAATIVDGRPLVDAPARP